MTGLLIAQAGIAGTLAYYGIIILVVAGIIGIVYIVARAVGVQIPAWLVQCFWVVLAVAVGILAIKLLISLV